LNELFELTTYKSNSKILLGAISSLIEKNFIEYKDHNQYLVPEIRKGLYKKVIKKNNSKNKVHSDNIINSLNSSNEQLQLIPKYKNISELNNLGSVHTWYNYLEDFSYLLIERKIKEYKLKEGSIVVDPFCGSGTTLITSKFLNMDSVGFDINPLMSFVSKIKTTWDINLEKLEKTIISIVEFNKKNQGKISSLFLVYIFHQLHKQFFTFIAAKPLP